MLREKLFVGRDGDAPKIAEYDGRGLLASWVRVVALRAAIDLRRRREAVRSGARAEEAGSGDPEIAYMKERYRELFNEAFRGAVEELGAGPRELLRLHFVEGLTLEALAARLGVHRATVARRIAAAREAVAAAARRRLRGALGASEAELESLVRVMRSRDRSEPDGAPVGAGQAGVSRSARAGPEGAPGRPRLTRCGGPRSRRRTGPSSR